jgi:predicted component of type VI protein secretion system
MASVSVFFAGQDQGAFPLDKPKLLVGRDPECEIRIDNLGISRQHCVIHCKGEAFVLQDLGSANGTFVNSKRVGEYFLNDGDEIVIGVKYALHFHNEQQVKAAAGTGESGVPETLNTYVMDGTKIQEQLEKMRAQASSGTPPSAPGSAVAPAPMTAKEHAKAMEPAPPVGQVTAHMDRLRNMLTFAIGAVVVLLAAVAALIFIILTRSA